MVIELANMAMIRCGHVFHSKCLKDRLAVPNRRYCPECQSPFGQLDILEKLHFDSGLDDSGMNEGTVETHAHLFRRQCREIRELEGEIEKEEERENLLQTQKQEFDDAKAELERLKTRRQVEEFVQRYLEAKLANVTEKNEALILERDQIQEYKEKLQGITADLPVEFRQQLEAMMENEDEEFVHKELQKMIANTNRELDELGRNPRNRAIINVATLLASRPRPSRDHSSIRPPNGQPKRSGSKRK